MHFLPYLKNSRQISALKYLRLILWCCHCPKSRLSGGTVTPSAEHRKNTTNSLSSVKQNIYSRQLMQTQTARRDEHPRTLATRLLLFTCATRTNPEMNSTFLTSQLGDLRFSSWISLNVDVDRPDSPSTLHTRLRTFSARTNSGRKEPATAKASPARKLPIRDIFDENLNCFADFFALESCD